MWLSIDQGGHASRALVFDGAGTVVARAEAPLATRREGLRVEHDAAQLEASVAHAIDAACRSLGPRARAIEAAGLATQRSTLVCVRRSDGCALTPVLSWQDRRGLEDMKRFAAAAERVKRITGLRLSPHYGVSKLRWCLQHDGQAAAALTAGDLVAAPLAAFLLQSLTRNGAWRVDAANASRTLLMDLESLDWSPELERLFAVPRGVLPEICSSRFAFGTLDCAGRQIPLSVATGDQSAALYCLGAPTPGTAFINVGTGAFVQVVTGAAPVADAALLASIVWWEGPERLYVLEGTVNGAGAAIEAVLEPLGFRRLPPAAALGAVLGDIERAPLFLNGIAGLGSPDWRADFPSRFIGEGSPMQKLAAVYESIVFLLVRNLERMRSRVEIREVVLTGGLARIDWLAQRLATLAALPVRRLGEPEATARGLAVAVSRGRIRAASPASGDRLFEPESATAAAERYGRWTRALEAALADADA